MFKNDYKSCTGIRSSYSSFGYKSRNINKMLKLTVLCAAAFFTLATADSLKRENETHQILFEQLIGTIDASVASIRKRVDNLLREPSEKNLAIIQEYKRNATTIFERIRSEFERIENKNEALGIEVDITECRDLMNDFEKTQEKVLKDLDDSVSIGLAYMPAQLTELLGRVTNETRKMIIDFEDAAKTCEGNACDDIKKAATHLLTQYIRQSIRALNNDMGKFGDGSVFRKAAEEKSQHFIAKTKGVVERIRDCLNRHYNVTITKVRIGSRANDS